MSGLYKSCGAKNAIFRPSTQTPQKPHRRFFDYDPSGAAPPAHRCVTPLYPISMNARAT